MPIEVLRKKSVAKASKWVMELKESSVGSAAYIKPFKLQTKNLKKDLESFKHMGVLWRHEICLKLERETACFQVLLKASVI